MKRSLSGAEIDFVAQEAEEILRAQVIAEEDEELRLREIALKQASIDKALSDRIEKWDKEGLMSAAHGVIRPPAPNPTLGSLLPFPSLPLFSLTTGFNLNHHVLGRHPTALSVMRHFVPRGIWKDLATTTQSKIQYVLSKIRRLVLLQAVTPTFTLPQTSWSKYSLLAYTWRSIHHPI